ncbi:MAG: iron-containing redox enzyme family protein [Herminiimonas sp.]|nr:iron-containing redox enzyme family protein [Herminiimonas sp.]
MTHRHQAQDGADVATITGAISSAQGAQPHERDTGDNARALYFSLAARRPQRAALDAARRYLDGALQDAASLPCDLPAVPADLDAWIVQNTASVGERYQTYLAQRKAGSARQYFGSKAHALNFLRSVAPTKTVDGAWLYGVVHHWNDSRFASLIRIYLEELGAGMPDKNHVVLYKKLLAAHGCERWNNLSERHFVQGTIQLSLAHQAQHFLPEIIGFNLGYEQLPLHLLICAYELNELGIDPYYFTLHVTVDNADTGHAKTALNGLHEAWPVVGDGDRFYERVMNGYKLNMLGADTASVIAAFDLEQELITILADKSTVGKQVHSDYCRVGGRSINDWLGTPGQIPAFLQKLQDGGWIKRGLDPQQSRFWQLLQGERAEMFGVFSAYELQVIHDWIAGDAAPAVATASNDASIPTMPAAGQAIEGPRRLSFKARTRLQESLGRRETPASPSGVPSLEVVREDGSDDRYSDFDQESRQLVQHLHRLPSHEEKMDLLADLMSPALHHTPIGLNATRLFVRMFR